MLARCGECCNAKDNASRRVAENVARCAGNAREKCRHWVQHFILWLGREPENFLLIFHQYLDVEQLFPIGFGSLFAGNAPEVFPDFVVERIDFGGFSIGDGAIGGIVHYFLLSAYMLFQTQMFYQRLFKTILLCSICQGVRLCFLKLLKSGHFLVECRFIDTVKTYILVW